MPLYEYECGACGPDLPFSAWRSMAERSLPAPCPACGTLADRVLSACAGGRSRPTSRGAEPRLVRHDRDPERPSPANSNGGHAHGPARPWMIGH
jgi:putative FmdB family regulatory protein